ncbi:hypothetical protein KIPB_008606, partial [Kipferlia bialata]
STIESVKAFDVDALSTHIAHIAEYTPLAKVVASQSVALREFVQEHKSKLVTEDCALLLSSLSALVTPFRADLKALSALDFDPAESIAFLAAAGELLDRVNAAHHIPLPSDHSVLSLTDKRKYYQVDEFNVLVRELFQLAGVVIDCQTSIKEYQGMSPVSEEDVLDAEYAVDVLEVRIRNHRLSETEREVLRQELTQQQQKVCDIKRARAERESVAEALTGYLVFPDVASALSMDQTPLDPLEHVQTSSLEGEVGMMVKRETETLVEAE